MRVSEIRVNQIRVNQGLGVVIYLLVARGAQQVTRSVPLHKRC